MDSRSLKDVMYPNFATKQWNSPDGSMNYEFTSFLRKKYDKDNKHYLIPVVTKYSSTKLSYIAALKRHYRDCYACILAYKISDEVINARGIYTDSLIYEDTNQEPELSRIGVVDNKFWDISDVVNQEFED